MSARPWVSASALLSAQLSGRRSVGLLDQRSAPLWALHLVILLLVESEAGELAGLSDEPSAPLLGSHSAAASAVPLARSSGPVWAAESGTQSVRALGALGACSTSRKRRRRSRCSQTRSDDS